MNYVPIITSQSAHSVLPNRSDASLFNRIKERRGVWILLTALVLTIVEGSIRKWVIGSQGNPLNHLAYFSKDIVFAMLLLLPARGPSFPAFEVFRRWLLPGCFLLLLGALLSSTQGFNIVGAVLTLRAVILLPLLAYYAVPRISGIKGISLQSVAQLLALFTIVNFALGTVQNSLPADHILNRYAADSTDITEVKSGVRATGTFSYITGLSVISTVGIWAGLTLISVSRNLFHQMAGLAAIAAGFGCGLASVSRGPVIAGAGILIVWILLSGAVSLLNFRSLVAGALFLALIVFFDLNATFSRLQEDLIERHETSDDTIEGRTFGQLEEALEVLNTAPIGNGFGTEQVGGNYYKSGLMQFTTYETQLPRLVLETGVAGIVGFLLVCAGAILALQAAKRESATRSQKNVLLATQLMLLPMLYLNVVYNHTASAFVWTIFTAVLSAHYFERYGKKGDTIGNISIAAR